MVVGEILVQTNTFKFEFSLDITHALLFLVLQLALNKHILRVVNFTQNGYAEANVNSFCSRQMHQIIVNSDSTIKQIKIPRKKVFRFGNFYVPKYSAYLPRVGQSKRLTKTHWSIWLN